MDRISGFRSDVHEIFALVRYVAEYPSRVQTSETYIFLSYIMEMQDCGILLESGYINFGKMYDYSCRVIFVI
jgi:hypothetical protein